MDEQVGAQQRLIEAGKQLFAERGFDGASVREIAKLANLAPNMINHHFGGKQALYDAIIEQFSVHSLEVPERMLSSPATSSTEFKVKFEMFVGETLQALIANRLVFEILTKHKGSYLPLNEFRSAVIGFLLQAQMDGYVRSGIDVTMVLGLVLDRLGNQILYCAQLPEDENDNVVTNPEYRKRWLDANINILLAGIAT